jgi:hypothetical protein
MSSTPILTFSQSFPFAASSRVKSVALRFHRSAHRSAGPSHVCRSPSAWTRAQDDPTLAPSGTYPSIDATSLGMPPPAVGGADGVDMEVCPITAVAEDASTTIFPSYPDPIGNDAVASGCAASVMDTAVSVYIGGGLICTASTCDAAVAPGYNLSAPGAATSACELGRKLTKSMKPAFGRIMGCPKIRNLKVSPSTSIVSRMCY